MFTALTFVVVTIVSIPAMTPTSHATRQPIIRSALVRQPDSAWAIRSVTIDTQRPKKSPRHNASLRQFG